MHSIYDSVYRVHRRYGAYLVKFHPVEWRDSTAFVYVWPVSAIDTIHNGKITELRTIWSILFTCALRSNFQLYLYLHLNSFGHWYLCAYLWLLSLLQLLFFYKYCAIFFINGCFSGLFRQQFHWSFRLWKKYTHSRMQYQYNQSCVTLCN